MANLIPSSEQSIPVVAVAEDTIDREVPFSLVWLHALDPRTFTPITWERGRETTIRLRTADGRTKLNVYRAISHYGDGAIELLDEVYAFADTEAGDQETSRFSYSFDKDGNVTNFDPATTLTTHKQTMVDTMSGLVLIPGSTIRSSNYQSGEESSFVSDGTQWIETRVGIAIPPLPAFAVGRLALGTPMIE